MTGGTGKAARLKLKAQLYLGEEIAIGPGKVALLEAIGREGSISAAGRALGMSYRRAWLLVDAMNRCWREPLVATTVGGRTGARLTPLGADIVARYHALEAAIEAAAAPLTAPLLAALRPAPLPAD